MARNQDEAGRLITSGSLEQSPRDLVVPLSTVRCLSPSASSQISPDAPQQQFLSQFGEFRLKLEVLKQNTRSEFQDLYSRVKKLEDVDPARAHTSRGESSESILRKIGALEQTVAQLGKDVEPPQTHTSPAESSDSILRKIDALEQTVTRLGDEVTELRGLRQPAGVLPGEEEQDGDRKESASNASLNLEELKDEEYEFSPSIWDAAFFIGMKRVGRGGSFLVTLLVSFNVITQVLFCLLVDTNFLEPEFSQNTIEGLQAWRNKVAHDQTWVSSREESSLAARVCGGDPTLAISTTQVAYLESIEDYLVQYHPAGPDSGFDKTSTFYHQYLTGATMCTLAIGCWMASIFRELLQISTFVSAIMSLPVGESHISPDGEDGLEMVSVDRCRRTWGLCIAALRLLVAALLVYFGLRYIANITSMEDMLLNAVALEFVLMIDELMYDAFCPIRTRNLIGKLRPVKCYRTPQNQGLDVRSGFLFIVMFIGLALLKVTWVSETEIYLQRAWDAMCIGNQDFVYNTDSMGMQWIVQGMTPFPSDEDQVDDWVQTVNSNHRSKVIQETIAEPDPSTWNYGLLEPLFSDIVTANLDPDYTRVQKIRHAWPYGCDPADIFVENNASDDIYRLNLQRVYQIWFQETSGTNVLFRSCADLAQYCFFNGSSRESRRLTIATRAWCPGTCGCNDPTGGTAIVREEDGCPVNCAADVFENAPALPTCPQVDPTGPATGTILAWTQELHLHGIITEATASLLYNNSCAAIASKPELCYTPAYGSYDQHSQLRPFKSFFMQCPEACGCKDFDYTVRSTYCAPSCFECANYLGQEYEGPQMSECLWNSPSVRDPFFNESMLNITVVAHNVDGLCCNVMRRLMDFTFSDQWLACQDILFDSACYLDAGSLLSEHTLRTMCVPCRRRVCVEALGRATVTIRRSVEAPDVTTTTTATATATETSTATATATVCSEPGPPTCTPNIDCSQPASFSVCLCTCGSSSGSSGPPSSSQVGDVPGAPVGSGQAPASGPIYPEPPWDGQFWNIGSFFTAWSDPDEPLFDPYPVVHFPFHHDGTDLLVLHPHQYYYHDLASFVFGTCEFYTVHGPYESWYEFDSSGL